MENHVSGSMHRRGKRDRSGASPDPGYTQINEAYLHKTGVRGRKVYCVYGLTFIIGLAAFVNIFITFTIFGVLRINKDGIQSLEFTPGGDLLRFLLPSDMGDSVIPTMDQILSLPDTEIVINGRNSNTVNLVVTNANTTLTIGPLGISMTTDLFEMTDPDTGQTVFSTDFSKFRFPDEMESLAVEQVLTHRVTSDIDKDLNIRSDADVTLRGSEGISVDGREIVLSAAEDVLIKSGEKVVLEGKTGPYLEHVKSIAYSGPSDDPNPDEPSYKVCVCVPSGKLFMVPSIHKCDYLNKDANPCSV